MALFWSPFALVAAIAHAAQAADGAKMSWLVADKREMESTLNMLNDLCS